jgi:hypothetical protein
LIRKIENNKKDLAKMERYYRQILENKLKNIKTIRKVSWYKKDLVRYLNLKQKKYKFVFNLLPPDNRILISSIGVNAPIVDLKVLPKEKTEKADFDEELYK